MIIKSLIEFVSYFCLETKVPKIQGFGFGHTLLQAFADYAKNQMNSAENLRTCSLRSLRTADIFYATFTDFLNASSPMPSQTLENH